MLETIRILKPSFVVGENVAGLVSMENGKTLDRILSDLEDEGYTTEQVIIPACAVGAWHRRDRIWIIAHNNNTRNGTSRSGIDRNGKAQGERWEQSQSQFSGYREDVPHPEVIRGERERGAMGENTAESVCEDDGTEFECCGKDVSNSHNQRQQAGGERSITSRQEWPARGCYEGARQWQSESLVGGMAYGLPAFMDGYWDREPEGVPRVATGVKDRVNRLKGLGNAIVPQIALQLFKAIAEYKNI